MSVRRRGLIGNIKETSVLPKGYTQIDHVEYYGFGSKAFMVPCPAYPFSILIDFKPLRGGTNELRFVAGENGNFQIGVNGSGVLFPNTGCVLPEDRVTVEAVIYSASSGKYIVNNVTYNVSRGIQWQFCVGNSNPNTSLYAFWGNIWRITVSNSASVAYDFIPCTRDTDNKNGFYDIINDKFYQVN